MAQGAFDSPQLFLLSGIGPEDELRRHGIPVARALPGVGQNPQDHLDYTISHPSLRRDTVGLNPHGLLRLAKAGLHWRKAGEGFLRHQWPRAARPSARPPISYGLICTSIS